MKLPHPLFNSSFFIFPTDGDLIRALGDQVAPAEIEEVKRLIELGLPPITSMSLLAVMLGVSPGLIWSFVHRSSRYYRIFSIPKGNSRRDIKAPKVALKIIQKWLSIQLSRIYVAPDHVFGFVSDRSHVEAAVRHAGAKWVFSVDIRDFFSTTPESLVARSLQSLGFGKEGAALIARLCSFEHFLAQGAPSSPVLSNCCFGSYDVLLTAIAARFDVRLTRYADDIVFSGVSVFPEALKNEVVAIFDSSPWSLAPEKIELSVGPNDRLKVHGLLVHGERVRLTKGYRKRLRALMHLKNNNKIIDGQERRVDGHLNYGAFVDRVANQQMREGNLTTVVQFAPRAP